MSLSRSVLLVFASVILGSSFTGCGGSQGPDPGTTKPENVPGYDFPIEDEYKNMDKLKDAVPSDAP